MSKSLGRRNNQGDTNNKPKKPDVSRPIGGGLAAMLAATLTAKNGNDSSKPKGSKKTRMFAASTKTTKKK